MDTKYSAFSFKDGNTVFHKMPAWIKLIFIPVFNVLIFSLDWKVALFFAVFQFFLMLFSKFTVTEQAADSVHIRFKAYTTKFLQNSLRILTRRE